jgi:lactate dehydrogenase-like 2-hydroxyacid dehydrogenase
MSATSQLPAVGFIGLGDQGAPIARAIAEAGYPLHAWARRPESLETLSGVPYTSHASVAELAASSDVVPGREPLVKAGQRRGRSAPAGAIQQ